MDYRLFEKGDHVTGDGFVGTVMGFYETKIGDETDYMYVVKTAEGSDGIEMAYEADLKPVRPVRDTSR